MWCGSYIYIYTTARYTVAVYTQRLLYIGTWTERGGQERLQITRQKGCYNVSKGTKKSGQLRVERTRQESYTLTLCSNIQHCSSFGCKSFLSYWGSLSNANIGEVDNSDIMQSIQAKSFAGEILSVVHLQELFELFQWTIIPVHTTYASFMGKFILRSRTHTLPCILYCTSCYFVHYFTHIPSTPLTREI